MQRQRFAIHFRFLLSKETAHPAPDFTQKQITCYRVAFVVIVYFLVILKTWNAVVIKSNKGIRISDVCIKRLYVTSTVFLTFAAKHTGNCSGSSPIQVKCQLNISAQSISKMGEMDLFAIQGK